MKNDSHNKKKISQFPEKVKTWKLSRKGFIQGVISVSVISQFPFLRLNGAAVVAKKRILTEKQLLIAQAVQEILFPNDGNGPGAKDIHAVSYLKWALSDAGKDPDEVSYILNGLSWTDETSVELFDKPFEELTPSEQEELIAGISKKSWGESWLSAMLTLIFEALLCDPSYGGNPEKIGWQWLNHNPGQPRPSADLLYPQILKTIRDS